MADRYWSANMGQDKTLVAETGSTTAAAHVEVRILYTTTALNKTAALVALDQIRNRIVEDTWPPA